MVSEYRRLHCALVVVLLFPGCLVAQSPAHTLFQDLFQNYNSLVRPVRRLEDVTSVTINLYVAFLQDLNERQQQLTAVHWIQTEWRDELLQWEPGQYGELQQLTLPASRIWRPDLVITNAAHGKGFQAGDDVMLTVRYDGMVMWYVDERAVTFCSIDVTKFPFDTQICPIVIWQWASSNLEINLTGTLKEIMESGSRANGEFFVKHVEVENLLLINQTRVEYRVTLERQHIYYILVAIVPLLVLSVLNLFVFFIPEAGGERLGVCVSLLLSYAVYASSLHSHLPETSSTICVLILYVTTMFGLKAATTVTCVLLAFKRNRKYCNTQEFTQGDNYVGMKECTDKVDTDEGEDKISSYQDNFTQTDSAYKKGNYEYEDMVYFCTFLALFVIVNVTTFTYLIV